MLKSWSLPKRDEALDRRVPAAREPNSAGDEIVQSFGIVEEKLREAEFFLDHLRASKRHSFNARCYFSAFVSAARSVSLALQTTMHGITGFKLWYQGAQARLKVDPLAKFFVEVRNDSIHKGLNPLNQVTLDHLREDLAGQLHHQKRSHVLVMPDLNSRGTTVLADAVEASTLYHASLVAVIFDCYDRFRCVVDPRWYFTADNFSAVGKTFEDAVAELGFPPAWASSAPEGDGSWRALRLQQPPCQLNDLFLKYVGREIEDPDETRCSTG